MGRGSQRGLVAATSGGRRAAVAALLALAGSGCALAGPSTRVDRAVATAPPAAWTRIAVLPFDGAPELSRPAEELVAVRIRHQRKVAVVPPLVARRALAAAGEAPPPTPAPAAWIGGRPDADAPLAPAPGPAADDIRAVAARLQVDGVVAGTVSHDATWRAPYIAGVSGAVVELALFDSGGAPVAVLRRRGSADAVRDGVHEAAMDAAGRVADDLLIVLGTAPGQRPALRVAPEPVPFE